MGSEGVYGLGRSYQEKAFSSRDLLGNHLIGAQKPNEHKDPTKHGLWNSTLSWPQNQNVASLCLCGLWSFYACGVDLRGACQVLLLKLFNIILLFSIDTVVLLMIYCCMS